ncbi:MAG TPA: hypothetical protein VLB07_05265 [Woeseiaceae bacterium]|nr:hypothetical protein [Woeseiaceae bacterium]
MSRNAMKHITWTKQEITDGKRRTGWPSQLSGLSGLLILAVVLTGMAGTASAGPREQAKQMHDRLAGVPPTEAVLASMEADIDPGQNNNPLAAAATAMSNPNFYNVTLKNFVAPWTNRDGNVFVPLNDYIATVVGMIRDDVPFNGLLSDDILYVATGIPGLPAYSNNNNNHYEQFEADGHDMMTRLTQTTQSSVTGIPSTATAGIMTTRAAAEAFFIAGTNRAMFRFTMLNHMCNDMEQVHYLALPPDRIRQDVSRSPGGDSRLFLTNCIGCHNGMDPMAQAFAYYNFNPDTGSIEYTPGVVQPKYFNNDANFPYGFRTPDDAWENRWRVGQNEFLGWDPGLPGSGNGAKSMGEELANSDAFAYCQVKKVFRAVCLRAPEDATDRAQVAQMVTSFKSGYRMKQTFAEAAVYCMGQ